MASGSGWNLWVWLLGVVVRRYIDFLILLIPTPLVSVLFCSSIPTFFNKKNVFRSCSRTFFKLHLRYILNNFFTQYNHIPATTGIPRHPYEGCTYCFIHEEAHTNVRFLSCDGHQLYERGVDLEVEGVRYILEMHRGPAAYALGPPPSRSRDLRRSHCMPRRLRIYTSPKTPTCEVPSNGVVEISLMPVRTGETSI